MKVVVVTGGGGGIGAAIAEELGRQGLFVVTMDPLVSLDGAEQLPAAEDTTAGRIIAHGGQARATSVSVTDADAVRALFADLADEFGRLDAVVNVAGISRPTSFARGTEDDWRAVLDVHLNGYRNVLEAALPVMVAAGGGRILGVTSGSGWRAADTGAYGCAKRAVAALTWQLGKQAPPGVVINALSPIAVTRMVTAALGRSPAPAGAGAGGAATGGLSLGSMPQPDELGPIAAHMLRDEFSWCNGEVIFSGGTEIALVDRPRLLEVVRTNGVKSVANLLEGYGAALAAAEATQASGGGGNPRFGSLLDGTGFDALPPAAISTCAVFSDRSEMAAAVAGALGARGVACDASPLQTIPSDFASAAAALTAAVERIGAVDAVVLALSGVSARSGSDGPWERVLAEHVGIAELVYTDASWARAVSDYAAQTERTVRLVILNDAAGAGGRSRAQAAAQLTRSARKATGERVAAFAVSAEGAGDDDAAALAAYLACSPDAVALSGAELAVGDGWCGLRSHPRPTASIAFGNTVPEWLDDALREIVR